MTSLTQTQIKASDFLTEVLTVAEYDSLIEAACSTYIETVVEKGIALDWPEFVNVYKQVWGQAKDMDFSDFDIPNAPELPADDFDEWVDQMESDYGDYDASIRSGIPAF